MAAWTPTQRQDRLQETLDNMKVNYDADPTKAVRSQSFIKMFHGHIAEDLRAYLTPKARKAGIKVVEEAKIFGSFKSKDVDVAVIHPINGPLLAVGVRSQMKSVGKNVLTYYQDIVGEAVSLQQRFPMMTTGYAYLHPLWVPPSVNSAGQQVGPEEPNHARHARMYEGIGYRDDRLYKSLVGSYDHFAYSVVDFQKAPVELRDDIVTDAVPDLDMSIRTFVPRLVETFHVRNLWVEDIFEPTDTADFPAEDAEDRCEELDDSLTEGA